MAKMLKRALGLMVAALAGCTAAPMTTAPAESPTASCPPLLSPSARAHLLASRGAGAPTDVAVATEWLQAARRDETLRRALQCRSGPGPTGAQAAMLPGGALTKAAP